MKICILTHPLRTNYGGLLQAFALQKVLRDMGHDVVTEKESAILPMSLWLRTLYFCRHLVFRYILKRKNYNPFKYLFTKLNRESEIIKKISVNTNRFIEQNIKTVDFFDQGIIPSDSTLQQFDALVVGSDQVWRPNCSCLHTPSYFLGFTKGLNIKRVAYAASIGIDSVSEFSKRDLRECINGAKLFDAISVREDSAVGLCEKHLDVEAVHLLDPTMLLSQSDYIDLIEEQDQIERDNVLMCYVLDKSNENTAIIDRVAKKLNLSELHVMPKYVYPQEFSENISECVFPSVSKWLAGFRDAKFVVTDSFHGTVFSIIFNKSFVAINNANRGSSRFISLLRMFKLEHRLISSIDDIDESILLHGINYEEVNNIRSLMRTKSLRFLQKHL